MSKPTPTAPSVGGNLYRRLQDRLAMLDKSHADRGCTPLQFIEKRRGKVVTGNDFQQHRTPFSWIARELSEVATSVRPEDPVVVTHESIRRWYRRVHGQDPIEQVA